jgi:hypothetical protein
VTIRKPTSGNRTERRGSRYIQNIHIEREAARSIKVLLSARGTPYTPEMVAAWVEELIEREWREYDDRIQAAADEAYEGGVL